MINCNYKKYISIGETRKYRKCENGKEEKLKIYYYVWESEGAKLVLTHTNPMLKYFLFIEAQPKILFIVCFWFTIVFYYKSQKPNSHFSISCVQCRMGGRYPYTRLYVVDPQSLSDFIYLTYSTVKPFPTETLTHATKTKVIEYYSIKIYYFQWKETDGCIGKMH